MWKDFKSTFPESETAQDGWIGDLAHASGTSGHNPDDTPGVSAERSDADSKQEVRAIDKDKRLNNPRGVTLEQVVQRMLRTPGDLKRLIYIIYDRRVWKKSDGWKEERYTGKDPHDMHGHFSGDPGFDEDGSEWTSITSFKAGGSIVATAPEQAALNADNALYHALQGHDPIVGNKSVQNGAPVTFPNILKELLTEVKKPVEVAVNATELAAALIADATFIDTLATAIAEKAFDPTLAKKYAKDGCVAALKIQAEATTAIP
jgi:hypothetical protein